MEGFGYVVGTSGLIMLLVVLIMAWRKIKRIRKYIKVPTQVVRIDKREWSGDTADREGGTYSVPILSYEIPNVGKAELGINNENSLKFMQVSKKTMVAFPKEDYNKVIVWDINFEMLEFIRYFFGGIFLIITGYLFVFIPQKGISLIYGALLMVIYLLLLWLSKKILKR